MIQLPIMAHVGHGDRRRQKSKTGEDGSLAWKQSKKEEQQKKFIFLIDFDIIWIENIVF